MVKHTDFTLLIPVSPILLPKSYQTKLVDPFCLLNPDPKNMTVSVQ